MNDLTPAQILRLIAGSKFRPMDSMDRQAFAGVESDHAMIHESDDQRYIIILDDSKICMIDEHGYESHYELGENILA